MGAKVLAAAESDSQFRADFLNDPKTAYKARVGEELLPGEPIEVKHLEGGATVLYLTNYKKGLTIPAAGTELSDDMLEMVAGGKGNSKSGQQSNAAKTFGTLSENLGEAGDD